MGKVFVVRLAKILFTKLIRRKAKLSLKEAATQAQKKIFLSFYEAMKWHEIFLPDFFFATSSFSLFLTRSYIKMFACRKSFIVFYDTRERKEDRNGSKSKKTKHWR